MNKEDWRSLKDTFIHLEEVELDMVIDWLLLYREHKILVIERHFSKDTNNANS